MRHLRAGKVNFKVLCEELVKTTGIDAVGLQALMDYIIANNLQRGHGAWIQVWMSVVGYFDKLIAHRLGEGASVAELVAYRDFLVEHCKLESLLINDCSDELSGYSGKTPDVDCIPPVVGQWLLMVGD